MVLLVALVLVVVVVRVAVRVASPGALHFAAGQELSEHTSKARALVQILSGTCAFSVGATRHTLRAGDLLHLPPGAPHALTAPEPFSMLLTQITEPAA